MPNKWLVAAFLPLLLLGACSSDKKPPLPGERLSVLQVQDKLQADKDIAAEALNLPEAVDNTAWPQAGGNATHMPQHLALGQKLKKLWSADVGEGSEDDRKLITAPVVAANRVFAADTNGNVSAFDLKKGKRLWEVNVLPDEDDSVTVSSGLTLGADKLFVSNGLGQLLALDPATGKQLWRQTLNAPVRGAPTYYNGRLYVITLLDETLALDANNGTTMWTHKGVQSDAGLLGSPSPAAEGSAIISAYSSGDVVALRAETGQEAWSDNLNGASEFRQRAVTQVSGFKGHPVIDQDHVIIGNASSKIVSITAAGGERLWQKEFGTMQTPWVAGDAVFIITPQNEAVALMKETGQVRWVTQLAKYEDPDDHEDTIFWQGPVMAGGRLFIAGSDEALLELDPQTGKIMRKTDIGHSAMVPPVVADGVLLLVGDNGTLTAYGS